MLSDGLIVQTKFFHLTRPIAFDDNVGTFGHLAHHGLSFWVLEGKDDGLLAPVEPHILNGNAVYKRVDAAGIITSDRPLDFNHVGTQVGQHGGGAWSGQIAGKIQNGNVLKYGIFRHRVSSLWGQF